MNNEFWISKKENRHILTKIVRFTTMICIVDLNLHINDANLFEIEIVNFDHKNDLVWRMKRKICSSQNWNDFETINYWIDIIRSVDKFRKSNKKCNDDCRSFRRSYIRYENLMCDTKNLKNISFHKWFLLFIIEKNRANTCRINNWDFFEIRFWFLLIMFEKQWNKS